MMSSKSSLPSKSATPLHTHVQQCLHKDEELTWQTRLQQSQRREEWHTTCEVFTCKIQRAPLPSQLHSFLLSSLLWALESSDARNPYLCGLPCFALGISGLRYNVDVCILHDPPCYLNSHFLSFSRGLQILKFLLLPIPRRQLGAK